MHEPRELRREPRTVLETSHPGGGIYPKRRGSHGTPAVAIGAALALLLAGPALGAEATSAHPGTPGESPRALPGTLRETGLYSDWESLRVHPEALPFSPQYPLWTDGAEKRRWIQLPPGTSIRAVTADHWEFPVGTRLWKELAFGGRRIETRYVERTPEGWRYAAYVWSADGKDAVLAPARGVKRAAELRPGVFHAIPGAYECRTCHEGRAVPVLGFSALQLSAERDPLAPHGVAPGPGDVDVAALIARGLLRGAAVPTRARIPAADPEERATLGYLHGNCGHCHNGEGPLASLALDLWQPPNTRAGVGRGTTVDVLSQFQPADAPASDPFRRVTPGAPELSVLFLRMASRQPLAQMPPLGTAITDEAALKRVARWIQRLPSSSPHPRTQE